MKKFFTLLGISALCATSMQAKVEPSDIETVSMRPGAEKMILANPSVEYAAQPNQKRIIKRSWTQGAYQWDLYIVALSRLTDFWHFTMAEGSSKPGQAATFEDLPFWAVQLQFVRNRAANPSEATESTINVFATWPCKASLDTKADSFEGMLNDENSKIASPEELAGIAGQNGAYCNELINKMSQYTSMNVIPAWDKDGVFMGWPIWSNDAEIYSRYNGPSNGQWSFVNDGTAGYTHVKINSAKDDQTTTNINAEFAFYLSNVADDTRIERAQGTYAGEAMMIDMLPADYMLEMADFHLFNAGVTASKGASDDDFFYPYGYTDENPIDSWTPVQGYYLVACQNPAKVHLNVTGAAPYDQSKIQLALTAEDQKDDKNMNWIRGGFWLAEGAEIENQQINLKDPEEYKYVDPIYNEEMTLLCASPEANIMLPNGFGTDFGAWPDTWGVRVIVNGIIKQLAVPSYLATSTPDGFILRGADRVDNTYAFNYKGRVVYHYDADNMNNTREIGPLVGTFTPEESGVDSVIAENVSVVAANGQITVASEGENISVFALDGSLVGSAKGNATFNVGKGLYIVVVGKASKKVIL